MKTRIPDFARPRSRTLAWLVAGLALPLLLSAESPAQRWSRSYVDPGSTYGYLKDLHTTTDGSLALLSMGFTDFKGQPLYLIDGLGNVEWASTYLAPGGKLNLEAVCSAADGNLLVAGHHDGHPCLVKVDRSTGAVLNTVQTTPLLGEFRALHSTSDGGCVATGSIQWIQGIKDLLVARFDAQGALLWQYRYCDSMASSEGLSIVETSSGTLGVTGSVTDTATADDDLIVMGLTGSGLVLWSRVAGTSIDEPSGRASICERIGGGFFVVSAEGRGSASDIWLLRLDSLGQFIWEAALDNGYSTLPYDLLPTPEGGCIVAGATAGLPSNRMWILELDQWGVIDWQRLIGSSDGGTDRAEAADFAADGGLFVGGFSAGSGQVHTRVLRLDDQGRLGIPSPYINDGTGISRGRNTSNRAVLNWPNNVPPAPSSFVVDAQSAQLTQSLYASTIEAPWQDLGGGTAGSLGAPYYAGVGTMAAGTFVSSHLSLAPPNAYTFLVAGVSRLDAPLFGGTLVPSPDLILTGFTDSLGTLERPVTWPSGIPSGTEVYLQYFVQDPGAAKGLVLSNALHVTTP